MRRLLALVTLLLAPIAAAADLQVHAAASLTDALTEIGARFTKATGIAVHFNFGGSSTLALQIIEGAPGDVFVPADTASMDRVAEEGLVVGSSRVSLLSNRLAIVVEKDSKLPISGPRDLRAAERIALAEPESVPAGVYARAYLARVGLWRTLSPKVVPTANVRAALAAVESGNVDAAIVYETDALISRKVRVAALITDGAAPVITYPAAVLTGSKDPMAAFRFVRYLGAKEARDIFVRYGFRPR